MRGGGLDTVSYTHLDVYKRQTKDSVQSLAEFTNTITSSVISLTAMQLPVDSFELIVIQLLSTKLDHSTFKLWKESIDSENLPNFQSFIQFLNARRQLLENTLPIEAGQQLNKPILKFNNKSEKSKLRNSAGSRCV